MQIVFDDRGQRREFDVRVNDPAATVADLTTALDPAAAHDRGLLIDGHPVAGHRELAECGLYEGAEVRVAHGGPAAPPAPAGLLLDLVGGLDAGRRLPLATGSSVLGRDPGCGLALPSHTVSRRHAEVSVDDGGMLRVRDLDSLNGTWLDGHPLTAEVPVPSGGVLRFGAAQAVARAPRADDRPTAVDSVRHVNSAGTIPFNRPPRPAPRASGDPIEAPAAPRPAGAGAGFNIVAFVAPLLLAATLYAATRQVAFLAFTLLSPIMVLGNWVQGRIRGRRGSRRERQQFAADLESFWARLSDAVTEEVDRLDRDHPDPAEVVRRVLLPSTTLWERRREHPDFLRLRVGTGDVPWSPPLAGLDEKAPDEITAAVSAASVLPRAPVVLDLGGSSVVGIVGDRAAAVAVARSLVCQAAVHHGPADLPVVVLTDRRHEAEWDWAKWLPHVRDPEGGARRLSGLADLSNGMIDGWLAAGNERAVSGPTMLVVVDDPSLTEGRRAPARALLRGGAGPVAGIVIAGTADRLPAVCTAVIELHDPDGLASLDLPGTGRRIDRVLAAGMADDIARGCAQALSRFEDPELAIAGAGLPEAVRLLPLLDLDDLDAGAVLARWSGGRAGGPVGEPRTPIGATAHGVLTVNLDADGPHGLVAGTTGSGKSELLRVLVAGLAASVDPEHLTFVLIDFKGGSAFDECARLPHTVGMVTDLDEHLAERALRCLDAELTHRERVLRSRGAADLASYQLLGGGPPLPRLVVVIDEFATLKTELPDFVDALVGVAQRGRSLGVHLILATQRPSGAVSDNIRANTNLRIALRVQDTADSSDIIDRPDAAKLPRNLPGRAHVRLGAGEVVAIQTALVTAARTDGGIAPVDVAPFVFGAFPRSADSTPAPPPRPPGGRPVTDLGVLVDAIVEAHRRRGHTDPRRPWPEPLPAVVDLDGFAAPRSEPAEIQFALADDPERQIQYPVGWQPAQGNLLVYGVVGAGTTTVLATIALGVARSCPADRAHLYVLDFGAGDLDSLGRLPHTGAVIGASERERQIRLVRHLRSELDRRRQIAATRRVAEPKVYLLLDGYAALSAEYRDMVGVNVIDDFQRVFADGPEVGIHVAATADRAGAVPSAMASLVRQKLLLRLADPYEYAQFGIPSPVRTVPKFAPGGGILAESRLVVQVAMPGDGLVSAVDRYAGVHPIPARPPAPIGQLPERITVADLGRLAGPAPVAVAGVQRRPWRIPIGIGDADLGPAWLVVHEGEHALIAGPARSGKTSTLATVAEMARAARSDLRVVTLAPARSPLPGLVGSDLDLTDPTAAPELVSSGHPTLVLVDDAEVIDDPANLLGDLLGGHPADLLVVAAGRAESLRASFGHWTRALRRSRLGVLLRPNVDLDGELLGVSLPRRVPIAMPVGRGFLVNNGELTVVQTAQPLAGRQPVDVD